MNKDNGLELTIPPSTMVQSKLNKTRESDGFVFPDSALTFILLGTRTSVRYKKKVIWLRLLTDIFQLNCATPVVRLNVVKAGPGRVLAI